MTYLSMEVSVNRVPIKLSENQRSEIASMTDAMYWTEASLTSDFIYMLAQEVGGVWIGEKSASDAANILQNRIQLYLNSLATRKTLVYNLNRQKQVKKDK